MLLALVASGAQLFIRKRRWQLDMVAGASVYLTPDVGPAVVGLLGRTSRFRAGSRWRCRMHQAAVIAHEQSHLEARDPQLFTVALALLVFMPWNLPLVVAAAAPALRHRNRLRRPGPQSAG